MGVLVTGTVFLVSTFVITLPLDIKTSVITQLSILVLSLTAICLFSKGKLKEYGFKKPSPIKWLRTLFLALGIGTAAASLGLISGHSRAKLGSLIPAVVVHMIGNIGGVTGGMIYEIMTFILSGRNPTL